MTLPKGATIEFADDPDAVRYVLDHPREMERKGWELYRVDPSTLLGVIMACPERWLIRMNGTPVACFYMFVQDGFVEYEICCTPEVDRYPVAYTKGTRAFIRTAQMDFPNHRHVVHAMLGSTQHGWLKLIGFRDLPIQNELAGGVLQLMELPPP